MSGKRARVLRKIAKAASDDPAKQDRAYRRLKQYWKTKGRI